MQDERGDHATRVEDKFNLGVGLRCKESRMSGPCALIQDGKCRLIGSLDRDAIAHNGNRQRECWSKIVDADEFGQFLFSNGHCLALAGENYRLAEHHIEELVPHRSRGASVDVAEHHDYDSAIWRVHHMGVETFDAATMAHHLHSILFRNENTEPVIAFTR